jgi:hypothetical protein
MFLYNYVQNLISRKSKILPKKSCPDVHLDTGHHCPENNFHRLADPACPMHAIGMGVASMRAGHGATRTSDCFHNYFILSVEAYSTRRPRPFSCVNALTKGG